MTRQAFAPIPFACNAIRLTQSEGGSQPFDNAPHKGGEGPGVRRAILPGSMRARSKVNATLHDPHRAVTWMQAAGVDFVPSLAFLVTLRPATTLSIYAHALPAAEARSVAAIDNRLQGAKAG